MKFIIRNILFLFNLIFVVGLGLAYLSPYVDPNQFWPLAFFGLSFWAWLIANVFFLFFWILFKRKLWIYNLLILLVGIPLIQRDIQFSGEPTSGGDLKVMFFNTRVLQVYNNGNTSEELNAYLVEKDFDFVLGFFYHHRGVYELLKGKMVEVYTKI